MRLVFDDSSVFCNAIAAMPKGIEFARLDFSKEGISASPMDGSHVIVFVLSMLEAMISDYQVPLTEGKTCIQITLNIPALKKVLGVAKKDKEMIEEDNVEMDYAHSASPPSP